MKSKKHLQRSMDEKYSKAKEEILSCWGRLKLIISCRRKSKKRAQQCSAFSFRYSPMSYAQNFDEWEENEDKDSLFPSFSSRYAAPFHHTRRISY